MPASFQHLQVRPSKNSAKATAATKGMRSEASSRTRRGSLGFPRHADLARPHPALLPPLSGVFLLTPRQTKGSIPLLFELEACNIHTGGSKTTPALYLTPADGPNICTSVPCPHLRMPFVASDSLCTCTYSLFGTVRRHAMCSRSTRLSGGYVPTLCPVFLSSSHFARLFLTRLFV